jgi:hypothetical protein
MKPLIAITLLCAAQAAAAQTIWRCGSSYSATPCSGGVALEASAPRPTADIDAARRAAGHEMDHADQLRAERLQREGTPGSGLAGIRGGGTPKAEPPRSLRAQPAPKLKRQRLPEEPGTWPAAAPSSRRTKG